MKILYYCQHVLGIGHFFRTLEICRALSAHRVTLVSGGPEVETELPPHVRQVSLPSLEMDADFKAVVASDPGPCLGALKDRRRRQLRSIYTATAPDMWMIELYPFGRKAFRFELDPLLTDIRSGQLPASKVICSLRDILVEKKDPLAYEQRVVETLNRSFDALLIHADPSLVRLAETFTKTGEIKIPRAYTGFVTPKPAADARRRVRMSLGLAADQHLIVASAGGGKVGATQLEAVVRTMPYLTTDLNVHLLVFSGPYMAADDVDRLKQLAVANVHIRRFTPRFLDHLAAADLSISMAGYNTCMNIVAARVPAFVWPFAQNREQRMRAEKLATRNALEVLDKVDLNPKRLAQRIRQSLAKDRRSTISIDLEGAPNTTRWLEEFGNHDQAG